MEEKLSTWLKEARDQDIIVETWMLSLEGKKILHDLYPWKFHNPEFDEEVSPILSSQLQVIKQKKIGRRVRERNGQIMLLYLSKKMPG